jgi:predicted dehydrogenase
MKFGIVGLGRHGMRYANHLLNDIDEAELSAVCRRDKGSIEEFLSEYPSVEYHVGLDSLLKSDIDSVIISTPTFYHEEMAIAALKAGKHVILEKPMAGTVEACRRIMEEEERSDRRMMIAQTLRYCPVWNKMKQMLPELPFPEWFEMAQYLEPPKTPWLMNRELAMGGCVLNTGVHVFDSFNFIFDAPVKSVECTMESALNPVWEDFAYGNVTLKGGIQGSFKIARDSKYRARTMRIDYRGGLLYGDSLGNKLIQVEDGVETTIDVGEPVFTLVPLVKDFIRCIENGEEVPVTGEMGMQAVMAAKACYRASEKGEEVWL